MNNKKQIRTKMKYRVSAYIGTSRFEIGEDTGTVVNRFVKDCNSKDEVFKAVEECINNKFKICTHLRVLDLKNKILVTHKFDVIINEMKSKN